jgi:hypothetical protein
MDEVPILLRAFLATAFPNDDDVLKMIAEKCEANHEERPMNSRRTESPMAFDEALAERIRRQLALRRNVEEKKMFGGVGFLLHGNLLVGVWKDSLVVRLGPGEGDKALKEPHVKEFDITGRAMKGWVLVGPGGVADNDQLGDWILRAAAFVGKLPAK